MDAGQLVEELRQGVLASRDLTTDLQQALDRHCAQLAALALSLQGNGTDRTTIRELVTKLLKSYEEDLIRVLEKNDGRSSPP